MGSMELATRDSAYSANPRADEAWSPLATQTMVCEPQAGPRREFGEVPSRGEVWKVGRRSPRVSWASAQRAMECGARLTAQAPACWEQVRTAQAFMEKAVSSP